MTAVAIIYSGASKNPEAMQLRRCLAYLKARIEFSMWATHIQGTRNQAADSLSRNNVTGFRLWCPQAQEQESAVPAELLDMLLLQETNWTRRDWMEQWTSSVARPADSTRRTYAAAKKRYVRFCTTHHINILPSTEQNLYRYVAFLAKEGVRATSIKCYLSAMHHLHIEEGWGTPNMADMPKLELVIRGIKKA